MVLFLRRQIARLQKELSAYFQNLQDLEYVSSWPSVIGERHASKERINPECRIITPKHRLLSKPPIFPSACSFLHNGSITEERSVLHISTAQSKTFLLHNHSICKSTKGTAHNSKKSLELLQFVDLSRAVKPVIQIRIH